MPPLSASARDALAAGSRTAGVTLKTLGRYALAGLAEPEALFQVHAPELRARFPKLRT